MQEKTRRTTGWCQLKNGRYFIKAVLSKMDNSHLYYLMEQEHQNMATLPDRVVTADELAALQV